MTWQVSPEEWLLDFTVIPRGLARGGDSLDVIDDRLREMLAPPAPPSGIVIPTITASRRRAATGPATAASQTGPNPNVAPGSESSSAGTLSVELRPIGPAAPSPSPPSGTGAGMVIPSLTRMGAIVDDDDDDDDDALALERISPVGSGLGIPHDDVEDVMSAVAASTPLLPVAAEEPKPEPEVDEEEEDEEDVQVDGADESEPPPEVADDEIDDEALEVQEDVDAPEASEADKPTSAPRPRPPTAPVPVADKLGPPRPPAPASATSDKAGPPRPPPTPAEKNGRPRPPPDKAQTRPPGARADGRKRRNWYEEVFGDHYGAILPADADASAEIDASFIQQCLDLASGMTLLDVGCGDGRHAHAFAQMGLDVTGLDNSMPQLLRAARRNEASKFNFDILQGDMRKLPRDRAYDAVSCLGTSFGYFETDEQNRQCLQDMVEVLKPGGKLALQVFNRDYLMGVLPCRSWWQGRGCLVLDVADMQFATGRVRIHRTVVFEDGRQFEHHISIRAYSAHTLSKMLTTLGAKVLELSGSRDTRGRFFGGASPEIWIFAQRRDDV